MPDLQHMNLQQRPLLVHVNIHQIITLSKRRTAASWLEGSPASAYMV